MFFPTQTTPRWCILHRPWQEGVGGGRKRGRRVFPLTDWVAKATVLRFLFSVGLPDSVAWLCVQKRLSHVALPPENVLPPRSVSVFLLLLAHPFQGEHFPPRSPLRPGWFVFQGLSKSGLLWLPRTETHFTWA